MKLLFLSTIFGIASLASPVFAQGDTVPYGTIEYGILAPDTAETYGIPLAPGEQVIETYNVPSIIRIPDNQGTPYETIPYAPPAEIDRVTGLPRNAPGWTGDAAGPAGIGCFPQGVCSHLNQ